MVGTCKTCRWWGHGQHYPYRDFDAGVRDTVVVGDAKRCGHPALVDIEERGYRAVGRDGFGLDDPRTNLVTGPDFGCLQHQEGA